MSLEKNFKILYQISSVCSWCSLLLQVLCFKNALLCQKVFTQRSLWSRVVNQNRKSFVIPTYFDVCRWWRSNGGRKRGRACVAKWTKQSTSWPRCTFRRFWLMRRRRRLLVGPALTTTVAAKMPYNASFPTSMAMTRKASNAYKKLFWLNSKMQRYWHRYRCLHAIVVSSCPVFRTSRAGVREHVRGSTQSWDGTSINSKNVLRDI